MASKEMFAKLKTARVSGSGNRIKQGKGRLIVEVVKFPTLFNGDTFIAEFKVLHSESIPGAVDKDGKPELANPPGTTCSIALQPGNTKTKNTVPGDIRDFIEKVTGSEPTDDEYGALLEECVNEDPKAGDVNPLRGYAIDFETVQKTIKSGDNAGKPFTKVRWSHVEQTDAEREANKAFLAGKAAA